MDANSPRDVFSELQRYFNFTVGVAKECEISDADNFRCCGLLGFAVCRALSLGVR